MHFLDQTAAIFSLQCVQSTVIVHLHRRSKWCHPIIVTVNPSHLSHHATLNPKFQIAVAVGGVVSVVLCCADDEGLGNTVCTSRTSRTE